MSSAPQPAADESEEDVEALIERHMKEIERLRQKAQRKQTTANDKQQTNNKQVSSSTRNRQQHSHPTSTDIVRSTRAVRSFSIGSSDALLAAVAASDSTQSNKKRDQFDCTTQSFAAAEPNDTQTMSALLHTSTQLNADSLRRLINGNDHEEEETVDSEPPRSHHHNHLRQRRGYLTHRSNAASSPSPSSDSATHIPFNVIVSAPAHSSSSSISSSSSSFSGGSHHRSRSANLTLDLPALNRQKQEEERARQQRMQREEQREAEEAEEEQGENDAEEDDAEYDSSLPPSLPSLSLSVPRSPFVHSRTPSMSERLASHFDVSALGLRSNARSRTASISSATGNVRSPNRNKDRKERRKGKGQREAQSARMRREEEEEEEGEEVEEEQEEERAQDLLEFAALHQQQQQQLDSLSSSPSTSPPPPPSSIPLALHDEIIAAALRGRVSSDEENDDDEEAEEEDAARKQLLLNQQQQQAAQTNENNERREEETTNNMPSAQQLADAIAAASSTIDVSQAGATQAPTLSPSSPAPAPSPLLFPSLIRSPSSPSFSVLPLHSSPPSHRRLRSGSTLSPAASQLLLDSISQAELSELHQPSSVIQTTTTTTTTETNKEEEDATTRSQSGAMNQTNDNDSFDSHSLSSHSPQSIRPSFTRSTTTSPAAAASSRRPSSNVSIDPSSPMMSLSTPLLSRSQTLPSAAASSAAVVAPSSPSPLPRSSLSHLSPVPQPPSASSMQRRMRSMFAEGAPMNSTAQTQGSNRQPQCDEQECKEKTCTERMITRVKAQLPAILQLLIPLYIVFQSLFIPIRFAFGAESDAVTVGQQLSPASPESVATLSSSSCLLPPLDYLLDLLFIFAILCTDYLDPSSWQWKRKRISSPTGVPLHVLLDIASSMPYELLTVLLPVQSIFADQTFATPTRITALMRLPRLLRLTRLFDTLDQFETRNLLTGTVNATFVRLAKLSLVMYLVAHLAGCGYVIISYIEGLPVDNEWIIPLHIRALPLSSQYLHSVHWGFCAMTGNGAGVEAPQTVIEHVFALIVLLLGVSTYATLIGNLSSIIQQMNSRQEAFRDKMTAVSGLMETYQLPSDVQHRVKSCFQYLFGVTTDGGELSATDDVSMTPRSKGEEWDVLNDLPSYLRNEVLCHINGEIIHKVPLFRGCEDGFIRSLVPLLRPEVVLPGDYIIRAGEVGREMYLIRKGLLEVIAHGVVVATLADGSYVGEVAVIFSQQRTASVRALTFCDILVLSKDDFDGVLTHYPNVQRSMRVQATMRRNARSMQDKEFRAAETEKANRNAANSKAEGAERERKRTNSRAGMLQLNEAATLTHKTQILITPAAAATERSTRPSLSRSTAQSTTTSSIAPSVQTAVPSSSSSSSSSTVAASTLLPSTPLSPLRPAASSVSLSSSPSAASSLSSVPRALRQSSTRAAAAMTPTQDSSPRLKQSHVQAEQEQHPPAQTNPNGRATLQRTQSKWGKLRLLTRGQ